MTRSDRRLGRTVEPAASRQPRTRVVLVLVAVVLFGLLGAVGAAVANPAEERPSSPVPATQDVEPPHEEPSENVSYEVLVRPVRPESAHIDVEVTYVAR